MAIQWLAFLQSQASLSSKVTSSENQQIIESKKEEIMTPCLWNTRTSPSITQGWNCMKTRIRTGNQTYPRWSISSQLIVLTSQGRCSGHSSNWRRWACQWLLISLAGVDRLSLYFQDQALSLEPNKHTSLSEFLRELNLCIILTKHANQYHKKANTHQRSQAAKESTWDTVLLFTKKIWSSHLTPNSKTWDKQPCCPTTHVKLAKVSFQTPTNSTCLTSSARGSNSAAETLSCQRKVERDKSLGSIRFLKTRTTLWCRRAGAIASQCLVSVHRKQPRNCRRSLEILVSHQAPNWCQWELPRSTLQGWPWISSLLQRGISTLLKTWQSKKCREE